VALGALALSRGALFPALGPHYQEPLSTLIVNGWQAAAGFGRARLERVT
jgi:hypothetical protein